MTIIIGGLNSLFFVSQGYLFSEDFSSLDPPEVLMISPIFRLTAQRH